VFHFDRRSGFWILRSNWYHILCQCLNDHVLTIGRLNLCQFHGFPIASTLSHISVIIPSWPTGITQIHVIKYIDPLIDSQLYYCCNWFHIIFIKITIILIIIIIIICVYLYSWICMWELLIYQLWLRLFCWHSYWIIITLFAIDHTTLTQRTHHLLWTNAVTILFYTIDPTWSI